MDVVTHTSVGTSPTYNPPTPSSRTIDIMLGEEIKLVEQLAEDLTREGLSGSGVGLEGRGVGSGAEFAQALEVRVGAEGSHSLECGGGYSGWILC